MSKQPACAISFVSYNLLRSNWCYSTNWISHRHLAWLHRHSHLLSGPRKAAATVDLRRRTSKVSWGRTGKVLCQEKGHTCRNPAKPYLMIMSISSRDIYLSLSAQRKVHFFSRQHISIPHRSGQHRFELHPPCQGLGGGKGRTTAMQFRICLTTRSVLSSATPFVHSKLPAAYASCSPPYRRCVNITTVDNHAMALV